VVHLGFQNTRSMLVTGILQFGCFKEATHLVIAKRR